MTLHQLRRSRPRSWPLPDPAGRDAPRRRRWTGDCFRGSAGGFDQVRAAAESDIATPVATPSLPATLSDATLRDFEADIEAALQTFQVPGAAVSLVQGDEIVFNRGFGVRNLASGQPVTPRTRFRIGSITKSMTALLLATLVDDGVFGWDDRAVDLWPEFAGTDTRIDAVLTSPRPARHGVGHRRVDGSLTGGS